MKTLLALLISFSFLSCNNQDKKSEDPVIKNPFKQLDSIISKPVFHVKVKFYGAIWGTCYYRVLFTNDNFDTETAYANVLDLTDKNGEGAVLVSADELYTESEAISISKTLLTYEQCIEHNNRVHEIIRQKRNEYSKTPGKPYSWEEKEKQAECKNTDILIR